MPRHPVEFEGRPLLDVASYARHGPGRQDRLSQAEIEPIARTVSRTPEVMVKVLTRGGQDLKAVRRHLQYLNRGGELELETDDGQQLQGKSVERDLLEDWDLDLEEHWPSVDLAARPNRRPPKLVHKLLFSMPPGTPPEKVLAAVKNFAREEFALKHRYAMVLHTDEPHPHVHMVVKAMGEQGERLNIRKSTLRRWRAEFAHHLRQVGVPANATERAVRGESRAPKLDGVYRAAQRGASTHVLRRAERVASDLLRGEFPPEPGKPRLLATRRTVEHGWYAVAESLATRDPLLAAQVTRFVVGMPPARTEGEWLAAALRDRTRQARAVGLAPAR